MPDHPGERTISAIDAEFSRLFREAWKEHASSKDTQAVTHGAIDKAIEFAKAQKWIWAEKLVEASRALAAGDTESAVKILESCEKSVLPTHRGKWLFLRGVTFQRMGDLDSAIKAFRENVKDPMLESPGRAWLNLGIVLRTKGDMDEAAEAFRRATEDPKLDSPGRAWVNLANVLGASGDFAESIQAYRKSFDDPEFKPSGVNWYNFGVALKEKGEFDESIAAFRNAASDPKFEKPGRAWNNMGNALKAQGKFDRAVEAYRKALEDTTSDTPSRVLASGFPQPINLADHAAKLPFRIVPFKVRHSSDVPHAMGARFELLNENGTVAFSVGYTGDTAYFEDLPKHLSDCDVVLAHISQPGIDELQDPTKLKESHLGYRGTVRLIRECQAKFTLIGEFWAGFADLRINLIKGLRHRSGVEAVFPAGLGLNLRIPSLEIECTQCSKFTHFGKIKVTPPVESFGSLAYLCEECLLQ